MTAHRTIVSALLSCLCGAMLCFGQAPSPAMSLPDYVAELDRLSAALDKLTQDPGTASALADNLPAEWTVQADGQTFQISAEWIKQKLRQETEKPSEEKVGALRAHVAALKTDAEAFQQPPRDYAASRPLLNNILSRHEFHNVRGPSWWDLLKERILGAIVRLLDRVFGFSKFPSVSKYFVWTLVAVAVLVLAFWIFKILQRSAHYESIVPQSMPVSAKQWPIWMAEAQAAAAKGLWRDAVHLAYWAGISFLEERGSWRPDSARTPREYLRLLAPASEYHGALTTLTREFEVVWYGYKEAGPESFAETMVHLENLGCRRSS